MNSLNVCWCNGSEHMFSVGMFCLVKIGAYKNILSLEFLNIRKLRDGAADELNLQDLFIDG